MPLFQPRNRTQILREMVARAVGRSAKLARLFRDSGLFHVLAAAANEDAEQYVQMARLRSVFALDNCRGSDLDARAAEIVPNIVSRRPATFATTQLRFSRPGTTGVVSIPVGTVVFATDTAGRVRFRTTAAGTIPNAANTSANVPAVAVTRGTRANVAANTIVSFANRIPGVSAVTNPAAVTSGVNRESDESFIARKKAFVQAISRGTVTALETYAREVTTPDGSRVLFAKVVEGIDPTGTIDLYIDDGTGSAESFADTYILAPDLIVETAAGGERNLYTTERPIRDDGSFVLEIDTGSGFTTLTRGTDYLLNAALGQIELLEGPYPTGLGAGDDVRATYRYYDGLIQETQRVIDGDPGDSIRTPGVRPAGQKVVVRAAVPIAQNLTGSLAVQDGFDVTDVLEDVRTEIQTYINNLGIGENVIVAEIIARAMSVTGMRNFRVLELTGSTAPVADQVILDNQVARITSVAIVLS